MHTKGKFFEITSSPTFPSAPQTIDQIPDSGFPIVSFLAAVDWDHGIWKSAVGKLIGFLARYRAYVIASKFFVVDTITFERINRLTSNFAHVETEQK